MIPLSLRKLRIRSTPDSLRPFGKAGRVDTIFRPRIFRNGVFATPTGYGVSFRVEGIDSEGLDRGTLHYVSKQVAIANRTLPEDCIVFEYLITTQEDALPGRPILDEVVGQQALERAEFLKATARFRSVRLFVTLYLPGKMAKDADEFTERSGMLPRLRSSAFGWPGRMTSSPTSRESRSSRSTKSMKTGSQA
jgi:hypothetical protein